MNKDQVEGKWNQFKGELQKTWGKLTNDEVEQFKGDSTKFYGVLQEKYGLKKEEAEKRVNELAKRYDYKSNAA